jgi:hypothetical protein
MKFVSKVHLQNSTGQAVTFILEPWGDVYRIPDGKTAHVVGSSNEAGCFHVEMTDDGMCVWAWERSEAEVSIGTERAASRRESKSAVVEGRSEMVLGSRSRLGVVRLLGRVMLAAGDRLLRLA